MRCLNAIQTFPRKLHWTESERRFFPFFIRTIFWRLKTSWWSLCFHRIFCTIIHWSTSFFPIWVKLWNPGFSFPASKFWRSYSKFWIHKRSKDSKRLRTLSLCIPHISFNFSITAKERPFWVSCQLEVRQTRIREFFELFSFFPFDTLSNLLAPLAYLYACPTQ